LINKLDYLLVGSTIAIFNLSVKISFFGFGLANIRNASCTRNRAGIMQYYWVYVHGISILQA
jgi:hypothetical protein